MRGLDGSNEPTCDAAWDLSVVIASEDSATAVPVCEVLEQVEHNLKDEGRLNYLWWNFEVLAIDTLRELAVDEAAAADMIIIGIHETRKLPQEINDWIELWLPLRKDRPGALVAVLDSDLNQPDVSQEILSQLKQVAALGQMDFFASRANEVATDTGMTVRVSDIVRRFDIARKNNAKHQSRDAGNMPATRCGPSRQSHHVRL
jgi:hypothetical protein